MKISFDRKEYLSVSSVFENESLDDVDTELSEFNDDATDMAYELAYTRYAFAKIEARHNALREAVAKMRYANNKDRWDALEWTEACAEVDRLIAGGEG